MGRITEALKKVTDERISRIQKKPEFDYVVKRIENTKIEPHIVAFHDPDSVVGEQYRIIRTNLQSLKMEGNHKTFLITSCLNSEGKTVTSVNLAMMMANDLNNKSILLIDADLRKGKVAKYLGLKDSPGLSEILHDGIEPGAAFVSPNIPNLTVIPSGKTPRRPAELLASKKMQTFLSAMKAKFDYVFIDSPPVMPLTDPCILGPMTDGVIVVIRAGRTQRDMIKTIENRLLQAHAKVVGFIMTNVEYHLPHYLYRYVHEYAGYGAYYQKEKAAEREAGVVVESS